MKRSVLPAPAWAALLFGIGLIAFSACGGDDTTPAAPTATAPAIPSPTGLSATPTAPAPEAATTPLFEGTRGPVEGRLGRGGPGGVEVLGLLMDVRTGRHEGFDRIVFEFTGLPPDYRVEYVSEAVACGSGLPAEVAGEAWLQVRFTRAAAHDDQGTPTFGATELAPGLPSILQTEQTCDFEADVTWVVGLAEELDFRVTQLRDPPQRLVIDVAHP